ncbi:uncharacterized protein [Amphiura filiformis]|uniref:uncharacterized protein n=1 Tax=Amphiura filiformis TaxID=82378 RepID=UPI003B21E021
MTKSITACLACMLLVACVAGSNPFVRRMKWPIKIPKIPKIPNPFGIDTQTLPEQKLNDFLAKITNQKCLWLDPISGSFKKVSVNWRRVVGCREYYCNSYGMIETKEVKIPGERCD